MSSSGASRAVHDCSYNPRKLNNSLMNAMFQPQAIA